jgi:hypothetical protein
MLVGCGQGYSETACASDLPTPNLDRINAAIERLDDDTASMLARVHNLESELQGEALHAAVDFISDDGWALAVVASTGQMVHEWGVLTGDCARACVDEYAEPSLDLDCRGVPVGNSGHVLCGSREAVATTIQR